MAEIKNISNSLEETIKDSDLQSVTIDLAETISDSIMNDGILKDLPIISTIVGISKTGLKIKERLFIKKIIYFISELKDIPQTQRNKLISQIDDSKKFRIKVGEKLLYIIEKSDDHEKSNLIGKLFNAFLKEVIDYDSFLRCSIVINKIMIEDLEWFLQNNREVLDIEDANEYITWGIYDILPMKMSLIESSGWKEGTSYDIEGGQLKAKINFTGKMLLKALKNNL